MKRAFARSAAAVLLALSTTAIGLVPSAAVPALARPSEGLEPGLPVQLATISITPTAPRPHELLTVQGLAHALVPVDGTVVRLRVSESPVLSRDELHAAAVDTERPLDSHNVGSKVAVGDIVPGVETPWSIEVPVDDLHLTFGVYRLTVEYFDADFVVRGRINTFLPYFPAGPWESTNVAWVWPLVDAPRRSAQAPAPAASGSAAPGDDASPTAAPPTGQAGETFLDDSLAATLAPDGRLGALVSAAALAGTQHGLVNPLLPPVVSPPVPAVPAARTQVVGSRAAVGPKPKPKPKPPTVERLPVRQVPVTWAIDPDVLESAKSMASGYTVRENGATRRGSTAAQQAAANWLAAVTTAVGDGPVIALPYADADIVALARAGRTDELGLALRAGNDADGIFRDVLSRQVAPSLVWPVGGVITQDALDVLASLQVSGVLLVDGGLPMTNRFALTATPGMQGPALEAGGGTVQPLVSDATLDGLIAADPSEDEVGLAQQRFLAETAMITAESPNASRDILLLPPRHATNTSYLRRLLALTGYVPWLNGITLTDALRHPAGSASRGPLTYPDSAKSQEVSRSVIAATYATRGRLSMLSSILTTPQVLEPVNRGLLRTYSTSWRQDPAVAERVRLAASKDIEEWIKKVAVIRTNDTQTLLSKSAKIPVTISNGLDQDVHGLRVKLIADNSGLLPDVRTEAIEPIAAHDKQQVNLAANVKAIGSIRFGVTVRLLTADNQVLSSLPLQVHSAGSGGTVLFVTLALMGLLFLVVAIRLVRRVWKYYSVRTAAEA